MADRAQLLSLAGIGNLITDQGVRSCSMSAFKSGLRPFFRPGAAFMLKRTPKQDDFCHLMKNDG